ncbi:MAG TPA: ribonuclease Y [bacterium]|nr:ribonuclease Y [bacterium]
MGEKFFLLLPWIIILWSAVSLLIGYWWRKYVGERTMAAAEKRAREIIQEAENLAQSKKREIDLEAKEIVFRLRADFERETRNKRREMQFQEKRLQQREFNLERRAELLEKKEAELTEREKNLQSKEQAAQEREKAYIALLEEEKKRLEKISSMSREEAKQELLKTMEEEARKEAVKLQRKIEEEARSNAEKTAREIMLAAMQRLASEEASESTVSVVSLPNDEVKGRIIGREGRNIRAFEAATGVDLIVDDTPEAVTISSFNLFRREIARFSLERLVVDGRIHPGRIEEVVERVKKELEEKTLQEGTNTIFEVGLENVHPELVKLLGRLKYRTSFGQNVLQHSKEAAFLAAMIAADLGLDSKLARRAALFHDIGKAVDQEVEGTHPEIGAEILQKFGENEIVVQAALAHHRDTSVASPYTVLTAVADAISATRPGARRDTLEKYLRRIEDLEKIASSFKGVDTAYAISAGREVRVIVKPGETTDEDAHILAREIAKKIEENLQYIGQVRVTVIREKRETEIAK